MIDLYRFRCYKNRMFLVFYWAVSRSRIPPCWGEAPIDSTSKPLYLGLKNAEGVSRITELIGWLFLLCFKLCFAVEFLEVEDLEVHESPPGTFVLMIWTCCKDDESKSIKIPSKSGGVGPSPFNLDHRRFQAIPGVWWWLSPSWKLSWWSFWNHEDHDQQRSDEQQRYPLVN